VVCIKRMTLIETNAMKILLIDPPINCFTGLLKRGYPVGLCMLAAVVKREGLAEVAVFDVDKCFQKTTGLSFTKQRSHMGRFLTGVNDKNHPVWDSIVRILKDFKPDIVGITTMTIQYASALRVAEIVKAWRPECLVVMGGAHANVMPHGMIEWPATDVVVKGEGEDAFVELVRRYRSGVRELADIDGVITKEHKEHLDALSLEVKSLDALPMPDRSALLYRESFSSEDMGLMITSRGCPYRCSYCSNFSRKTRFRSVDNILQEMSEVRSKYGTIQFMFKDDAFTLNRRRVEAFCDLLLRDKGVVLWECATRLDLIDNPLVRVMKAAGCNRVGVGVESGDEEILKMFDKQLTLAQIRSGADVLNRNRMFWTAYFMVGLPMENEEQIVNTVSVMRELRPSYAAVGIYKPYPGTRLFEFAKEQGLVDEKMSNDHFFVTNPVDYFLVDPRKRSAILKQERLDRLTRYANEQFENYNRGWPRIFKRACSRRKLYLRQPKSLMIDLVRAGRWLFS